MLSSGDLERLRPFVPPGYLEQLNFPSFKMKVVAVRSHQPRQDYVNCTERYQAQVRLAPDGALTNHICGQPFSNASLNPSDPVSGLKAAWNFELRWQNYGEFDATTVYVPLYFGGTHDLTSDSALQMPPEQWLSGVDLQSKLPPNIGPYVQGGGTVRRTFSSCIRGSISPIWPLPRIKAGYSAYPTQRHFSGKSSAASYLLTICEARFSSRIVTPTSTNRRQLDLRPYQSAGAALLG